MKKKLIFAGAVVLMAAAALTAYMANYRPDPFDLLNANIEALAQDESLDPGESNGKRECFNSITSDSAMQVRYCPTCEYVPGKPTWYAFRSEC